MTDDVEYGPAMSVLSERQRKFVLAMLSIPGCSYARAAREAGYSDVGEGAKVQGHYAAHNPKVQAAMREEAGKRLNGLSVVAANVMMDIMLDEEIDPKTKLKAAAAVLDRTGFAAAQNINVNKTVTDQSGAAIMESIKRLADRLGVPVAGLLAKPAVGIPATVVEAEFSEVTDG